MDRRKKLLVGAAALLAGCVPTGQGLSSPQVPAVPPAPPGWISIGSFAGPGASGFVGSTLAFRAEGIAVNAACAGSGTLLVFLDWDVGDQKATSLQSVAVPCAGDPSSAKPYRVEMSGTHPAGPSNIAATIVPGQGSSTPGSFAVSVEQREP